MTRDEQRDLLLQHKYSELWEHCKYIGHKIVPDIHMRYAVFIDIVYDFDVSKNNCFLSYYKSHLNFYSKNEAKKDFICPENRQLRALRIRQNISPDPDEYKTMCVIRDKLKFIIGP
jgi:hypothetical protein